MTQQTKRPNLLPYLLVLLVLVGVYGFMNKPVEAEPSYAEVRELFESEQVSAFTVTDTTLRMKLREPIDGKTELKKDLFSVTLFYDDLGELIEQQKADGIIEDYDFTADHSINYVAMFAPYILAVLGIFAIWYFLSVRSAGGGGGDRMAKFGTASFKTGGDNKRPTTFSDVAGADEEKEELQEQSDEKIEPQEESKKELLKGISLLMEGENSTAVSEKVAADFEGKGTAESPYLIEDVDEWRAEAWEMMRIRQDLHFMFITKRIDRLQQCLPPDWGDGYDNVTICCTMENQDRVDYRLPIYKESPIKHKIIICEPLLSQIDFRGELEGWVEQVVAGGESGKEARVCNYDWVLDIRRQCVEAHVGFWFKQTGSYLLKDGHEYKVARQFQHSQARKAELNYTPEK